MVSRPAGGVAASQRAAGSPGVDPGQRPGTIPAPPAGPLGGPQGGDTGQGIVLRAEGPQLLLLRAFSPSFSFLDLYPDRHPSFVGVWSGLVWPRAFGPSSPADGPPGKGQMLLKNKPLPASPRHSCSRLRLLCVLLRVRPLCSRSLAGFRSALFVAWERGLSPMSSFAFKTTRAGGHRDRPVGVVGRACGGGGGCGWSRRTRGGRG
mgnify:CR=1 FL=1